MRRADWSHREWVAFGIMVSAIGLAALTVGFYSIQLGHPCVAPGCNIPEGLSMDHYTVSAGSDGQLSLLVVWLRSFGAYGQTVTLHNLSLNNINNVTNVYSVSISGEVPANSLVPLSVDTGASGFHFVQEQCYTLTLAAGTQIVTFGDQICP